MQPPKVNFALEPDSYFYQQVQINKENSTRTSVYLNKDSNPARHVTVIPINNMVGGSGGGQGGQGAEGGPSTTPPSAAKNNILQREEIQEESYYDAIFEFDTPGQKQQQYRQGNIQNSGSRQQGTEGGGQPKATSASEGKKKVTKSNSQSAAGPSTSVVKTVVTKQASVTRSGH